jgi:hypothetical protein
MGVKEMGMMEKMMDYMMGRMSAEEKDKMMGRMMEKFFADMTAEDKQKMMSEMMPRMMEGANMMEMMPGMMMGMMGGEKAEGCGPEMIKKMKEGAPGADMPMMPQMMTKMMPQCLKMMLPKLSKEERGDFALRMVSTLMEQGSVGMSEEERNDFIARAAAQCEALRQHAKV